MKDESNAGLPRIQSAIRRRPVWDIMVLSGVEKLTSHLMSGAECSADDLSDMRALRQRLRAFGMALEARERAAGVSEVVE
jgi:hypothetical protein